MSDATLSVKYKYFWGLFESWDGMFAEAAEFASRIGRERLISISHSQDGLKGVIAVWYWGKPGNADA